MLANGQQTILDLKNEIISQSNQKIPAKEIKRLKEEFKRLYDKTIENNKKLSKEKRYLKKFLKDNGDKLSKSDYKDSLRRINEIDAIRHKNRTSVLENQYSYLMRKGDWFYTIDDNFTPHYGRHLSTLLKQRDPAMSALKRLKKYVVEELKKARVDPNLSRRQLWGLEKFELKVDNSIDCIKRKDSGEYIEEDKEYLFLIDVYSTIISIYW